MISTSALDKKALGRQFVARNMMPSKLRVGIGRADVSPPLGTRLFGYPIQDRPAESLNDPLNATALVFERDGFKAAILSLDWCLVGEKEVDQIRSGVEAGTGIPSSHITVCATHTHSAPTTIEAWGWGDKDSEYIASSLPKIIGSVVQANDALQPARVGIGTTLSDLGINRREIASDHSIRMEGNLWGVYDPEMTVLRFVSEVGPVATLVHYGAHPTALGAVRFISRDWPGVMIDRLEKITKAPVMFINGALGDIAPRASILSHGVGDGLPASWEVGCRAAADALRAYHAVKEFRDLELALHVEGIELPLAPLPPLPEAKRSLETSTPHKDEWGSGMADFKYWQAVVEAHDEAPRKAMRFLQALTRLGPVVFVPFAGEPFTEIVLRLRHLSPFQHTLCASAANGSHGYYVTRESRLRGGYEVWVGRAYGAYLLADHIDDFLVEENLRLLKYLAPK